MTRVGLSVAAMLVLCACLCGTYGIAVAEDVETADDVLVWLQGVISATDIRLQNQSPELVVVSPRLKQKGGSQVVKVPPKELPLLVKGISL